MNACKRLIASVFVFHRPSLERFVTLSPTLRASSMHIRRFVPSILFLLWSVSIALELPAPYSGIAITKPNSSHHHSTLQKPHNAPLQPRVLPNVFADGFGLAFIDPSMALIISITSSAVVVIVASFVILIRLFSNILDNCLTIWALNPPVNQVVIEAGKLRLEFGCSMQPVPWQFVAEFAESRRDAAKRGFAEAFSKSWWFDKKDRSRFCYAGIRIVPEDRNVTEPG